MTLREKIGQLFMLGIHGTEPSKELRELFKTYQPGGVILFSRNLEDPEQATHLTNALQKLVLKMPLLVAIDQEGGRVARLPKGFTVFPGQGALGRIGTTDMAYAFAEVTARELRAIGVNMDLAPVLDVNTNPHNPIIGDRSFGQDPELVETLGLAVIAGLQDNGVLACVCPLHPERNGRPHDGPCPVSRLGPGLSRHALAGHPDRSAPRPTALQGPGSDG